MAADLRPDHWIASYTYTSSNLTIPLASLTGLTAGEANATSGDIRRILVCLMDTLNAYALAHTTASTTMSIQRAVSDQSTGARLSYNAGFTCASTSAVLSSDP